MLYNDYSLLFYRSNKENNKDSLIYMAKMKNSNAGSRNDSKPFHLQSTLVAGRLPSVKGTTRWFTEDISPDGKYVLLTLWNSSSYRPLYIVDLSGSEPSAPSQIILPNSVENEEEILFARPQFSRVIGESHILYSGSNAYGDFTSLISYDISTKQVLHITTPEPNLRAIKPIPWNILDPSAGQDMLYFRINADGWTSWFVMPLTGNYRYKVIEIKPGWEGGYFTPLINFKNNKGTEFVSELASHKCSSRLAHGDIADALNNIKTDEAGNAYVNVELADYPQATPAATGLPTHPPKLIRYKSFDGLEVPALYYHSTGGKTPVPAVINIHGGPAGQATTRYRMYAYFLP
jgi:dipeptidyl aminopeptidase/acylaminoacyl peptidase